MKNLFTLLAIFLGLGIASAQTEAETLEWLNMKKYDIIEKISSIPVYSKIGKLNLDSDALTAYDNTGANTKIYWNSIKNIKKSDDPISIIISNNSAENYYIRLNCFTLEGRDRYVKALQHMATLKGTKLYNDDLF